jgi:hypothetical protein
MRIHIFVLISFFSLSAQAHIRSKTAGNLIPRSTSDSLKTAPCGGVARSVSSATYAPGATITLNWEETINHPGRFEIYFSPANDANWQLLKTVTDTMDGTNDLPHQYSTTVTLPSAPCAACTIQLIQVMTENMANPSYYYSCSDIKIQSATAPPAPQPTPHPDPCN